MGHRFAVALREGTGVPLLTAHGHSLASSAETKSNQDILYISFVELAQIEDIPSTTDRLAGIS